ncbi:uncharacterized protein LOC131319925 isoform X4 [Rhododendron vialii]|uniref:uncharacterized protein LOC131319925 isoform X4 n=1 Tax=Rhododendron vialii TaxID=182163 RepID=UPI00265E763E|nr:uncharacterized protein LOC131319925 isoform X4 [Rhododendron vialii]
MYFNSFNLTKRRLLGLPLLKKFELFPIAACAACFSTFSFSLCSLPLFNVSTLTKMVKPFQMYDLYKMWFSLLSGSLHKVGGRNPKGGRGNRR